MRLEATQLMMNMKNILGCGASDLVAIVFQDAVMKHF